jgi:hypothetical protein
MVTTTTTASTICDYCTPTVTMSFTALGANGNGPYPEEPNDAKPVLSPSSSLRMYLPKECYVRFGSGAGAGDRSRAHNLGGTCHKFETYPGGLYISARVLTDRSAFERLVVQNQYRLDNINQTFLMFGCIQTYVEPEIVSGTVGSKLVSAADEVYQHISEILRCHSDSTLKFLSMLLNLRALIVTMNRNMRVWIVYIHFHRKHPLRHKSASITPRT